MSAFIRFDASLGSQASKVSPGRLLELKCPGCSSDLGELDMLDSSATATCVGCKFTLANRAGIWRGLAPHRQERFRQFAVGVPAIFIAQFQPAVRQLEQV